MGDEKLIKNFTYCTSHEGAFDLCQLHERQMQYRFHYPDYAPRDLKAFFVVNNKDLSIVNPMDLAEELQLIIDKYIYSSNKEKIKEVIMYLSNNEEKEWLEECKYKVSKAQRIIKEQEEIIKKYSDTVNNILTK